MGLVAEQEERLRHHGIHGEQHAALLTADGEDAARCAALELLRGQVKVVELLGREVADVREAVEREPRHKPLDTGFADACNDDLVRARDALEPVDDLPVLVEVLDDAAGVGALVDPLHLCL